MKPRVSRVFDLIDLSRVLNCLTEDHKEIAETSVIEKEGKGELDETKATDQVIVHSALQRLYIGTTLHIIVSLTLLPRTI